MSKAADYTGAISDALDFLVTLTREIAEDVRAGEERPAARAHAEPGPSSHRVVERDWPDGRSRRPVRGRDHVGQGRGSHARRVLLRLTRRLAGRARSLTAGRRHRFEGCDIDAMSMS